VQNPRGEVKEKWDLLCNRKMRGGGIHNFVPTKMKISINLQGYTHALKQETLKKYALYMQSHLNAGTHLKSATKIRLNIRAA